MKAPLPLPPLLLLVVGWLTPVAASAQGEPLAVMPLPGQDASGIAALLRTSLAEEERFSVLTEEQTREKITAAADLGLTCEPADIPCLAKLGVLADLRWVLAPLLGTDAKGASLQLVLIDVESGKPTSEVRRYLQGTDPVVVAENALVELLDPAGYKGWIVLDVKPAGAEVLIDGESAGEAPLADPVEVRPGLHQVEVRLDGGAPYAAEVEVGVKERARLAVDLDAVALNGAEEQGSVIKNPFVLAGAAVTGLGAAIFLLPGALGLGLGLVYFDLPFVLFDQEGFPLAMRQAVFVPGLILQVVAWSGFAVMLLGAVGTAGTAAFVAYSE